MIATRLPGDEHFPHGKPGIPVEMFSIVCGVYKQNRTALLCQECNPVVFQMCAVFGGGGVVDGTPGNKVKRRYSALLWRAAFVVSSVDDRFGVRGIKYGDNPAVADGAVAV